MRRIVLGLIAFALAAGPVAAQSRDVVAAEQAALQKVVSAQSLPLAVFVDEGRQHLAAAQGPIDVDTPMRIASNTKTFVAATVLKLWEQQRIDLDAPIAALLAPETDSTLRAGGYDTSKITVRHLLSHSGGLYDIGSDPRYIEQLKTNHTRHLTRADQIRLLTDYSPPLSAPGVKFRYSDGDYVLLGEIIERITGQTLAAAVRQEVGFQRLGLRSAWWEWFEKPPAGAQPRARQFLGDLDVTEVDPSMDLYGGGGLVMSPRDLATFYEALFSGHVFRSPATLQEMFWKGPHEGADTYRLGIFVKHTQNGDIWWHTGFWGTYAGYAPSTGIAITAFSDHQAGVKPAMPALETFFFPQGGSPEHGSR